MGRRDMKLDGVRMFEVVRLLTKGLTHKQAARRLRRARPHLEEFGVNQLGGNLE